jgi:predicted YcjX-like family ATPase
MQVTKTIEVPTRLKVLVTLAMLLERIEHSAGPVGADQYRSVVRHLDRELAAIEQDDALEALLQVFPAMAQLYENLRYGQAGLCRSSLDDSLSTELAAKAAIARASRSAA